jgi:hypothetical protein
MVKILLVPMFVLPLICSLILLKQGNLAGNLTWLGIGMANLGIWLQT